MTKEELIEIARPTIEKQTLYQFDQLKKFIDNSLRTALTQSFENDAQKIAYLADTLYNIRDFASTLATENNVRTNILNELQKKEQELELGNELEEQKEKSSQNLGVI